LKTSEKQQTRYLYTQFYQETLIGILITQKPFPINLYLK